MNSAIGFTAVRRGSEQEKARANAALRKALSYFPDLAVRSIQVGETELTWWGRGALESCAYRLPDHSILLLTGSPAGDALWETVEKQFARCSRVSEFRLPWDGRVNLLHVSADGKNWTLWNDFIGTVPVYYAQEGESRIASTLEPAVVSARCFTKDDFYFPAVIFFLIHGHFFSDWTLYRGMKKMLPDCVMEWSDGEARLTPAETVAPSEERYESRWDTLVEELHSLLEQSVTGALRSSPSWIIPLSSGLDSRFIAAAAANRRLDIKTFTWGPPSTKDVLFSEKIAKTLGLPWQRIDLGTDYLKECLPLWRDLFGSAIHFHGMYQVPFYNALKLYPPAPIASGFLNDVFSGLFTSAHSELHKPDDRMLYTLPESWMLWKVGELKELFLFPVEDAMETVADQVRNELDATKGRWYQKLNMLILRGRQHHFTYFQSLMCDYWRGVSTPYVNRAYARFWMSLPRPVLDNRLLLLQMAKRYYYKVMEVPGTYSNEPVSLTGRFLMKRRVAKAMPRSITRQFFPEFEAEKRLTSDILSLKRWGKEALWPIPEMSEVLGKWMNMGAVDRVYEKALGGDIASVRKLQVVQTLAYRMMD